MSIFCRNEENAKYINEEKRNPKFFTHIELNGNVSATSNFKDAISDASFIISCIPCQQIMGVLKDNKSHINPQVPFVSCSKGMLV